MHGSNSVNSQQSTALTLSSSKRTRWETLPNSITLEVGEIRQTLDCPAVCSSAENCSLDFIGVLICVASSQLSQGTPDPKHPRDIYFSDESGQIVLLRLQEHRCSSLLKRRILIEGAALLIRDVTMRYCDRNFNNMAVLQANDESSIGLKPFTASDTARLNSLRGWALDNGHAIETTKARLPLNC
jgi:hypothetical protein